MEIRTKRCVTINENFNQHTYDLLQESFWKRVQWLEENLKVKRCEEYHICGRFNDNHARLSLRLFEPILNCNLQNVFITFRIFENHETYLLNGPGVDMNNGDNWHNINDINTTELKDLIEHQYRLHIG